MVFYFSATGNSKYAAERIANEIGDKSMYVVEYMERGNRMYAAGENESVGIVTPTYFGGLPKPMHDFLDMLEIGGGSGYVFFVSTCGTTTGGTGTFARHILRGKGVEISAFFDLRMPDAWTPVFDLTDKEKVKTTNEAAETELSEILMRISRQAKGNFMHHKFSALLSGIYYLSYGRKSRTRNFTVGDGCTGCGLCALKCPEHAIEMRDKHPAWIKESCAVCLGCLHRCPEFAIQYGKNTKKHGQYLNPNTSVF
ncbi:MAG: EFR1 family ferrodoxin [Bacteroidales bacterium]|jgi:NAD-dependent dihydropyrimidine dehydrogenase PreA subunit/flavodoxin|nr:EFR1 family ferrodoxin [Bacteroidales bacterium]MCI2122381.1 EFR1 family ferrodoxin [Bacteroidales bacterium]MCI2144810.1 EFR1 family ferrodoxin [Bacteroidales bacterium]